MKKSNGINQERRLRLFLLVFLIGFCIFIDTAFADDLGEGLINRTDKLAKMKQELEEKRKSIEQLSQKEKSAFEELLNLEERLDLARESKRQLKIKERNLEEKLQMEEKSLEEIYAKLILCREQYRHRVREIYKHRKSYLYTGIFETAYPLDLTNRLNFIQMILLEDQSRLSKTQNARADLEEGEQNIRKTRGDLFEHAKRKTEEEAKYQQGVSEKNSILKKIKSEKKTLTQTLSELENSSAELEKILSDISPKSSSGFGVEEKKLDQAKSNSREGLFDISKGKLPWPIRGKVISRFGEQVNPRFQVKLKNSGIEIESEPGAEVVAVADGRVIYCSGLRGYGNLVVLEHDGGYYTLYARLSEILVSLNQEVERLQTIGVVGENGFAPEPTLHFEIREGKLPQNPLEWLR